MIGGGHFDVHTGVSDIHNSEGTKVLDTEGSRYHDLNETFYAVNYEYIAGSARKVIINLQCLNLMFCVV